MQHLNYCRQMTKSMQNMLKIPSIPKPILSSMRHTLDLASASEKFILPIGGKLFEDIGLRGLDNDVPLKLPHRFVALEFELAQKDSGRQEIPGVLERTNAMIVFAREVEESIVFSSAHRFVSDGTWEPLLGGAISKTGSRKATSADGQVATEVALDDVSTRDANIRPMLTILNFLNAMACSNVKAVKSTAGSARKAMRKKGALPFDDYHVLTINIPGRAHGSGVADFDCHRSPREHLRRGHIRRYESGLKVWVNAHLVNPGIGGKVSKDYRLAA